MADSQTSKILHALQIHPRVAWSDLAPILGMDASTLSRRWRKLSSSGQCWISCHPELAGSWYDASPSSGGSAYVGVRCDPALRENATQHLKTMPEVWTIESTTGTQDLLLSVATPSWAALDALVSRQIGSTVGIRQTITYPIRTRYVQPSDWRMSALSLEQAQKVAGLRSRDSHLTGSRAPTKLELAIMRKLALNGRSSASQIAVATGNSISGITRAVRHILGSQFASFSTEFEPKEFGYRFTATLWISAPQRVVDQMGAFLRRYMTVVRECVSVIGRMNLYVHMWVTSIEMLDHMEEDLMTHFPAAHTIDRFVTLRFIKRAGYILGPDGRHEEFVS